MSENNLMPGGDEEALSDLIASAIEKKRTSSAAEQDATGGDDQAASDEELAAELSDYDGEQPDDGEPSIEEMVANAMKMKANGKTSAAEEHFVSKDDIERKDELDIDDENDDGERIGFIQKIKNFFAKHKLELIITGLVLIVIAIIVVIAAVLIFNHYYDRIERGDSSVILETIDSISDSDTVSNVLDYEEYLQNQLKGYADIMASEEVYNLLLIGEDLRDTAQESRGNTDVMMLVSINRETKQITLTSFMRDIYLYIPGYYSTRLNAAYATGGAQLLMDTIEQNFGINIDNYVIVNFYTFIDIIDTLGGIDVELSDSMIKAIAAPMWEQNKYLGNPKNQDIPTEPGSYHLNGNQALGYVRIRHGVGDDYGRTARQREVIGLIIDKARGMSLIEMKTLLDRITEGENVRWDLEKEEVLSLLSNAFDYYKNYKVQELRIPADGMFTEQTIRGAAVLCPDFDANTELLQMTIYGDTFVDPNVTSTYYLPPSPPVTTQEPYVVYTTTTTTPPPQTWTPATTTEPTTTTTEAPPAFTETTPPPATDPPEVTTTPEDTTTTTLSETTPQPTEQTTTTTTTTTTTAAPAVEQPPENSNAA